jgi:hypothetical protein
LALALEAPASAAVPTACSGPNRAPAQTITGEFGTDLEGSYVLVPFDVPAGTTAVRVRYCWDQPDSPTSSQVRHTLDLGIYEPREGGESAMWGEREFRGWGGSSHPDVTLSAEGFSTEAQYRANPRGHVAGKTTRGFRPGPIVPGRWAAELGVAAVAGQQEGDSDGKVAWRVEVDLATDPAFADEPYRPAPYNTVPARSGSGWYAGDMHVHAEHSSLGDATMTDVFNFAFGAPPQGAGLDFITLSDYVTDTGWGEIGRHQAAHPGKLVIRSSEVITYRGHTNNHASLRYVDYRTGPIWERRPNGALTLWNPSRSPQHIFDRVHAAGGWTQVNHPTIFPSEVPLFSLLCRGCPWDYADSETDWRKVDSYEVQTGPAGAPFPPGNEPGPNPFTPPAIAEWDRLRTEGYRVTGVGVSDSHNAGATPGGVTQSPIGEGSTVVFAPELSEEGIQKGIEAGHAYVRMFGHESPDLRLTARAGQRTAMMGDAIPDEAAQFEAKVIGGVSTAQARQLIVFRDGVPIVTVPVIGAEFTFPFPSAGAGSYRIQVMRGNAVDALSNPITLGARPEPTPPPGAPPGQGPGPGPPSGGGGGGGAGGSGTSPDRPAGPTSMRLSVSPVRVRAGRRVRFRFKVLTRDATPARVAGVLVRFGGRKARTDVNGIARITVRHMRTGRKRASASKPGLGKAVAKLRVLPAKRR